MDKGQGGFCEHQNLLVYSSKKPMLSEGHDNAIIQSDKNNRAYWRTGISKNFYSDTMASLEQSSLELVKFIWSGLFNIFIPSSRDVTESRQKKKTILNSVYMPRIFDPQKMQQQL